MPVDKARAWDENVPNLLNGIRGTGTINKGRRSGTVSNYEGNSADFFWNVANSIYLLCIEAGNEERLDRLAETDWQFEYWFHLIVARGAFWLRCKINLAANHGLAGRLSSDWCCSKSETLQWNSVWGINGKIAGKYLRKQYSYPAAHSVLHHASLLNGTGPWIWGTALVNLMPRVRVCDTEEQGRSQCT
jgi:hypothetical protein